MQEVINPTIISPTETTPQASSISSNIQPTVQNVYSPQNVQQALTTPQQAPNLNDPLGMKTTIESNLGLPALRTAEQNISAQLQQARQAGRAQQQAISNIPQALNVIRGEQAVAGQQQALNEQALAEQVGIAQTARLAAEQQASEQFNILNQERTNKLQIATQYPGANISVYDSYDTINKKVDDYNKKMQKEAEDKAKEAEKAAYKQSLKQTALQFGIKTSGKSTKELEKSLKKYYGNEQAYKQKMDALDMQAKQLSLASARKSLSNGASSVPGASPELSALSKAYATTGGDWGKTANMLANQGFDVSSGSVIDNELRRRNGLEPIVTGQYKAPTALQSQASGFASRLQSSSNILKNFDQLGSSLAGYISGSQYFPNALKSSDRQQMEQAQRDFINAQLRRESGAAIASSEFENAAKQYFPQPGDSPQVIQQKQNARNIAVQNMVQAAGPSYTGTNANSISLQSQIEELKQAGYTDEQINSLLSQ